MSCWPLGQYRTKAESPGGGSGSGLSLAAASLQPGQGEVRLELCLLGRGKGREVLPLEAAQQEGPGDVVRAVVGGGTVAGQTHVLALAEIHQKIVTELIH